MVGHELFHIANQEDLSTREEEFRADRFDELMGESEGQVSPRDSVEEK